MPLREMARISIFSIFSLSILPDAYLSERSKWMEDTRLLIIYARGESGSQALRLIML